MRVCINLLLIKICVDYFEQDALIEVESPSPYLKKNACSLWMMPKIHKERVPVPGRAIVQGYAWMEATAKATGHLVYLYLMHLNQEDGFTYQHFRPTDELTALNNTRHI